MGTFLSCNRLKRKLNAEQHCLHTQNPPKMLQSEPCESCGFCLFSEFTPCQRTGKQLLSGVMLAWEEMAIDRSHCAGCHMFCLSGMQEQYELVYDAVIELFKREIQALDAQKDSAASQVKVPGKTPCLLQPGHFSFNLNSCCRPGMNSHIFCSP